MASSKKQLEIKKKIQEIQKSSTISDDGLPWSDNETKCTHCDKHGCVVSYSIEASVNSKVNIWGGLQMTFPVRNTNVKSVDIDGKATID